MNQDTLLEIALEADYKTTMVMLNTCRFLLQYNFWYLKNQRKPISFENINRIKNSLYWNITQEEYLFNTTLHNVMLLIEIASKYNGRVFGGFVRNVLVPQTFNQKIDGYKDVDLWFQSEVDASNFVNDMGELLKVINKNTQHYKDAIVYQFKRKLYRLQNATIDIIISETLPVNDLNVNQLTYSFLEGYQSFGSDSIQTLITLILNKKAKILPGFTYVGKDQEKRLDMLKRSGWVLY